MQFSRDGESNASDHNSPMTDTMNHLHSLKASIICFIVCSSVSHAQRQMPQDYWENYNEEIALSKSMGSVAVGPNGLIYAAVEDSGWEILVMDRDFNELRSWGSFARPVGIAVNSSNEIHVYDLEATNKIQVFDTNGGLIRAWGGAGSGEGQFAGSFTAAYGTNDNYSLLGISSNDNVYALDPDNYRVQIFSADGTFIRSFGSQGDLLGQFSDKPTAITVMADGSVCVFAGWKRSGELVERLQLFDANGNLVSHIDWGGSKNLTTSPDQLIVSASRLREGVRVFDQNLNEVASPALHDEYGQSRGMAFLPNGDLVASTRNWIGRFRRQFFEVDSPKGSSEIPLPYITSLAQRDGTTLVDIDYVVSDQDSSTATTAMVIYAGLPSLDTLLLPETLAEGTEANLGAGIATNANKRVTWNAGADWETDVGTITVEILAKDDRGLFPIHWTTMPRDGENSDFQISADPVTNADLYSLWVWLVATRSPSVSLVDGEVIGVGGGYDGQTFYDGTDTTASGRDFLLSLLNVEDYGGGIVKKLP